MTRAQAAIGWVALVHIGMGLGVALAPHADRIPDQAILYELLIWQVRAGLWIAAGVAAVVVSRWSARWAWVLLSLMPALRVIGHAWSAWAYLAPGVPAGLATAIPDVILWLAVLGLIRHMAGWPDLEASRHE